MENRIDISTKLGPDKIPLTVTLSMTELFQAVNACMDSIILYRTRELGSPGGTNIISFLCARVFANHPALVSITDPVFSESTPEVSAWLRNSTRQWLALRITTFGGNGARHDHWTFGKKDEHVNYVHVHPHEDTLVAQNGTIHIGYQNGKVAVPLAHPLWPQVVADPLACASVILEQLLTPGDESPITGLVGNKAPLWVWTIGYLIITRLKGVRTFLDAAMRP